MSIEFDVVNNVPQWAVSGLVYGDWSNCTDEERALAVGFLNRLRRDGWSIVCPIDDTENEFCSHPAFGLAGATVDMKIRSEKEVHNG